MTKILARVMVPVAAKPEPRGCLGVSLGQQPAIKPLTMLPARIGHLSRGRSEPWRVIS